MQVSTLDVTREFRKYREAARLMWNVFLVDFEDQEDIFPEVNDALFRCLLESKSNVPLTVFEQSGIEFFSSLKVSTPRNTVLAVSRNADANVWHEISLPAAAELRYSGLFDFDAFSGTDRDFQYLRCARLDSGAAGQVSEVLVIARDATISYLIDAARGAQAVF